MMLILIVVFIICYAIFEPNLDYTREKKLLLWYNTIDNEGLKVRKFKVII